MKKLLAFALALLLAIVCVFTIVKYSEEKENALPNDSTEISGEEVPKEMSEKEKNG